MSISKHRLFTQDLDREGGLIEYPIPKTYLDLVVSSIKGWIRLS